MSVNDLVINETSTMMLTWSRLALELRNNIQKSLKIQRFEVFKKYQAWSTNVDKGNVFKFAKGISDSIMRCKSLDLIDVLRICVQSVRVRIN